MSDEIRVEAPPIPTKEELGPVIAEAILNTNRLDGYGKSNLIVGVMHRIWTGNPPQHITSVFYADGTVNNIEGLLIGRQHREDHFPNIMYFKAILQMIPFLASYIEGDYVLNIGTEEEIKEEADKAKDKDSDAGYVTLVYVFRMPAECPIDRSNLRGIEVMDTAIADMATDPYAIIKEGEF